MKGKQQETHGVRLMRRKMTGATNNGSGNSGDTRELSKSDIMIGTIILISAQLAAASTASCVHALPHQTPSVLRGLWRQTLTSIIFAVLTLLFVYRRGGEDEDQQAKSTCIENGDDREKNPSNSDNGVVDDTTATTSPTARVALIVLAVVGATLLNDTIVVALQYATSAAVMCLCNTTPIWLILYAIVYCGAETPGIVTILGASLSLIGAIVCATTGGEGNDGADDGEGPQNESLGAIIATIGGIGGAMYMTACRKLAPVGIHPIFLTLIINAGMMTASFLLCLITLPDGISIFSTDITDGFFGFLNPAANPAALFHSIFPDCGGNFGIMLALSYFEPLIVSMVMLTEPLNASLIAMNVVNEAPPSRRTIIGVAIVLTGCGVVLWESSKEGKEMAEMEYEEEAAHILESDERKSIVYRRRTSQAILLSPIGTIAPDVTAKAAFHRPGGTTVQRRLTLPSELIRDMSLTTLEREESNRWRTSSESDPNDSSSRRITLTTSILRNIGQRLSFTAGGDGTDSPRWGSLLFRGSAKNQADYGAIIEEEEEAK